MRNRIFVAGVLSFFFSITISQAQTKDSLNFTDKQGKKQGKWIVYDKKGQKTTEGTYSNGVRIGDFIYFYPNGDKKSVVHYSGNGKDATYKGYNEKGTLVVEGFYKNEKRDGLWTFYNNSNEKIAIENYKNGEKDGLNEGYNKDGKLQESIMWKNGEKEGKWYREKIRGGYLIGYYKEGKLDGTYEEHAEDGTLQVKGQYRANLQVGEWLYFDSKNQLEKVEHWRGGELAKSQIIVRTLQQENITLNTDSIAYFYNKGRVMCIKKVNGETLQVQNKAEHFIEVVGETSFMLINYEMKFYASYDAVKGIQSNPESDKLQVDLNPAPDFEVFADKQSARGLKIFFGQNE